MTDEASKLNQYRIRQYRPGAWCVEELRTSGEKSKAPGVSQWVEIKYPGGLRLACNALRDLLIGFDAYTIDELETAVARSEAEILSNVTAYVAAQS